MKGSYRFLALALVLSALTAEAGWFRRGPVFGHGQVFRQRSPGTQNGGGFSIQPQDFQITAEDRIKISEEQKTAAQAAFDKAVRRVGGQSANGAETSLLCRLADNFSKAMHDARKMGHYWWDHHQNKMSAAGASGYAENVAHFSPSTGSVEKDAEKCVGLWRSSPGHWANMKPFWANHCNGMYRGSNGVYCTALYARGIQTTEGMIDTRNIASEGTARPALPAAELAAAPRKFPIPQLVSTWR
ncbi:hypothetical protein K2X33_05915 [bacterium]|nr:hypothetical protein [bacterium]